MGPPWGLDVFALHLTSHMPQSGNFQNARGASRPGLSLRLDLLHISRLRQVRCNLQYTGQAVLVRWPMTKHSIRPHPICPHAQACRWSFVQQHMLLMMAVASSSSVNGKLHGRIWCPIRDGAVDDGIRRQRSWLRKSAIGDPAKGLGNLMVSRLQPTHV